MPDQDALFGDLPSDPDEFRVGQEFRLDIVVKHIRPDGALEVAVRGRRPGWLGGTVVIPPDLLRQAAVPAPPTRAVAAPHAPVGARHPGTAQRAAQRALPRSGTFRERLLDTIKAAGQYGHTDGELEQMTHRPHQSVSACRNSLVRDGWIVDSGRTRVLPSGNQAIVWIAR